MRAEQTNLRNILTRSSQYIIPVFQRHYSWKKKDWTRLWNDIVELFEKDDIRKTHFMGSLVFVQDSTLPSRNSTYHVIDGQQRMLTISLLLIAIKEYCSKNNLSFLSDQILDSYLTHKYDKGMNHFRIFLKYKDRIDYESAIKSKKIQDGNIKDSIYFFIDKIQHYKFSANKNIENLFDTIVSQLEFVNITLEKEENEYKIFKDLNSAGVDLSQADLIRGFIFEKVDINIQDEFDEKYWRKLEEKFQNKKNDLDTKKFSYFFRDFNMKEGLSIISNDEIFKKFQEKYDNIENIFQLVEDLIYFSGLYDYLGGDKNHPDRLVNVALGRVLSLEHPILNPFILKLLDMNERNILATEDLIKCLNTVTTYVFRRAICKENNKTYGSQFASMCKKIEEGGDPLGVVESSLFSNMPGNNKFINGIINNSIRDNKYVNIFLKEIENYMNIKEKADLTDSQIEHIMPQNKNDEWRSYIGREYDSVHEKYLQTLGNMTLTGFNQNMQDKSFSYKKPFYKGSKISITQSLAECDSWTDVEIIQRAKKLSEIAIKVWSV